MDGVEAPRTLDILQGVEQAVDLRPNVGPEQIGEVAIDQRQLEAASQIRQPAAEVGEEHAQVGGRNLGQLTEIKGPRPRHREGRKRDRKRARIEQVGGGDHEFLRRAEGLVEAGDVEAEGNRHVESGPRGREIDGSQPVGGGLRGEFAERHPAGRRLDQVERDADVERDLHIGRPESHHAEAGVDVGQGVGADLVGSPEGSQIVELHEDHLLGGESGREVDPEVEPAGEAGRHVDLDGPEHQALVGERPGPRRLAEIERIVRQVDASFEIDAEPEPTIDTVGFELGRDRRRGQDRIGCHRRREGRLHVTDIRGGGDPDQPFRERRPERVAERQERADRLGEGGGWPAEQSGLLNLGQPGGERADPLGERGGLGGGHGERVGSRRQRQHQSLLQRLEAGRVRLAHMPPPRLTPPAATGRGRTMAAAAIRSARSHGWDSCRQRMAANLPTPPARRTEALRHKKTSPSSYLLQGTGVNLLVHPSRPPPRPSEKGSAARDVTRCHAPRH